MAMVKCPECGRDISSKADKCLNCGYSVMEHFEKLENEQKEREKYNQRIERVKLPPKHMAVWYIYCESMGFIVLLAIWASYMSPKPPERNELIFCLVICALFSIILPILIYRAETKRYKRIQANIDGYKKQQIEYEKLLENKQQIAPLKCITCGSKNISVSFQAIEGKSETISEIRKKNVVTRIGNKAGRVGMIMATGGLWAIIPKKSNYKEIQKEKTNIKQIKMAVCQNCGYSWKL